MAPAPRWFRAIMPSTAILGVGLAALGCADANAPSGLEDSSTSTTSGSSVTSATTSGATDTGVAQTAACAEYLACLDEIAPDEVAAAQAEIGPSGSCWQAAAVAANCDAECALFFSQRCDGGSSSDTGEPPLKCSIEGLLPGAPSPIDAGDGVGQLPTEIGDVLERNCGCHYIDAQDLGRTVPAYKGAMPLATWQDFHSPFLGTLIYLRVQQRAVVELSMPPVFFCDSLAFGSLSAADHALLEAWLGAEAPDGASWP